MNFSRNAHFSDSAGGRTRIGTGPAPPSEESDMVLVGLLAAVLTTGSWIPQLLRVWRTRSSDDLSWGYLATFTSGLVLWLVYGISRRDPALTIYPDRFSYPQGEPSAIRIYRLLANGLTLAFVLGVVEVKRRGRRQD